MPLASDAMSFPRQFFVRHISTQDSLVRLLIPSISRVQQGCTTSPLKPWAPHVGEDVRATIRTIGVAVAAELPRVTVELTSEGTASDAGREAGKWSENWLIRTHDLAQVPRFFATTTAGAMLVVTPVVAAAGAVCGSPIRLRTKETHPKICLQHSMPTSATSMNDTTLPMNTGS